VFVSFNMVFIITTINPQKVASLSFSMLAADWNVELHELFRNLIVGMTKVIGVGLMSGVEEHIYWSTS